MDPHRSHLSHKKTILMQEVIADADSHPSHKNHQEAEETEGITSLWYEKGMHTSAVQLPYQNDQRSWRIDGETKEKEKKWFLVPKCHF